MQHRFISALHRQPVDRTPIWLMRQAGRYLPEYRKIRAQAGSFMQLCKNPELSCEVTLQPLQRFPLDAAIVFSDILTIPDAMHLELNFVENEGPVFNKPVRTLDDIRKLPKVNVGEQLSYVTDTIKLIKKELSNKVPLIGFSGSPWTLATYMVQGGPSKDFALIKSWLYKDPQGLHQLLTILANTVSDYCLAQIEAGADVMMLFDTWGGVLTPEAYELFSLHYMQEIIQSIKSKHPHTPVIIFTKGGGQWLEKMVQCGCNALGIDWTTSLQQAQQRVGHQVALQGNLDPTILMSTPQEVQQAARAILTQIDPNKGFIFNLGHGILQHTPPENVAVLVETVQQFTKQ